MRQTLVIAAAFVAGLAGGILGARMTSMTGQGTPKVVRAHSFELLNEAGQAISFWGVDKRKNVVLAFGRRPDIELVKGAIRPGQFPPGLENPENQLTTIGVQPNDSPSLVMRGADGKSRLTMYLSDWAQPSLLMEDGNAPRILLGIEQSDTPGPQDNTWGLIFPPDRARIGTGTKKVGGETYVRGYLHINRDRVKYP